MKKLKLLLTILTVFLLVICMTFSVNAAGGVKSGNFGSISWTLNESTGELVISGSGAIGSLADGGQWLDYAASIKSVVIKEGVTGIGISAFRQCKNLASVSIPNSVTSIGYLSFWDCNSLTEITIPDGCTYISEDAFTGCMNIATVKGPHNVIAALPVYGLKNVTITTGTTIPKAAFQGRTLLETVSFPDNITEIGGYAFYQCINLKSVNIPSGVKSIGDLAFADCKKIESIVVPDSVTSLGNSIFSGCGSLRSAVLPKGIDLIPKYMFQHCESLTSIDIPDTVKKIDASAFYGCDCITELIIPDSVTTIGDFAFSECTGLKTVVIPDNIYTLSGYAFQNTLNIEKITTPIAAARFIPSANLKTVVFTSGSSIPKNTFDTANKLKSVIFCVGEEEWKSVQKDISRLKAMDNLKKTEFSYHDCKWKAEEDIHVGICSACGSELKEAHEYGDWEVVVQATENSVGDRKKVCACGKTVREPIPVLSHEYSVSRVVAPTCTERGYTVYTCKNCSDSYNDNYVDVIAHVYDGEADSECNACGAQRALASSEAPKTTVLTTEAAPSDSSSATEPENDGGCSALVGGYSAMAAIVSIGFGLVCRKRKE